MYTKLNRLFENDEIVSQEELSELGDDSTPEEIDSNDDSLALPAEGESSAADNPMTLTVSDFLERCRSIDPLVCMGIEKFIQDKMMDGIDADQTELYSNDIEDEDDLSFSAQVEPARDELDFPA